MVAPGVPMALMLFAAQAASAPATDAAPATGEARAAYGPDHVPSKPEPIVVTVPAPDPICQTREQQGQIVICAPRPQGYRLNPDVMEAKREKRSGGAPKPPEYRTRDNSCQVVGPMGCFNAGVNLLAAAATAAEMAKRLAEGKEIGSMFVTDPHPDEYHLYLIAKARREAREAEEAAAAKAKAKAGAAKEAKRAEQKAADQRPAPAETPPAQPSRE
jgi:hypothetical protein